MDTLYIVMPAYNESANIRGVIEEWYPVLDGKSEESRIVVADYGSKDDTHTILESLKESFPKLVLLSNDNQFHGPKVIALYKYAIENKADYIFQTDSDGQTSPKDFDAFWNDRTRYVAQFGNRTIRGDGADRAFVEKVVCLLLKIYFKVNVPDANAPYRLFHSSELEKYISKIRSDYDLPNIILTAYYSYSKELISFKEISFKQRNGGVNSINISRIIKIGFRALNDFRYYSKLIKD